MPQVLKDEVRERLLAAALQEFSERGFAGATMTGIAERAGVGAASTYRYFAGKRELFDAVLPAELVARFEALLERRVRALGRAALGTDGGPDLGDEMLTFWVEHRLAVAVLLDRAEGTPHAAFAERFVELLVEATLAQVREARPGRRVSAPARFVLTRLFEGTRRTLAAILVAHAKERELREAIEAFWSYQVPGMRGFTQWLLRD
jgi:AcrR family transcriptional regulator